MSQISELERRIYDIGSRMVRCTEHCAGINLNVEAGILPRHLILEVEGRQKAAGTVVVGMNPGMGSSEGREFYRTHGQTYEQTVTRWNESGFQHPYYKRLRKLVGQLGLTGPILWTELVKCENAKKGEKPPMQTFRTCMRKYLNEELRLTPMEWPLIGAGKKAYKALAYRYPNRVVIGVPHPTGGGGPYFLKLFDENDQLHHQFKLSLDDLWDGTRGKAIWLLHNAA